jgi:dTDP-3-amino-3,4,6-trideoxy-alpha-D-glucose transaminase
MLNGNRDGFMTHLRQHQVQSAIHYPGLIPDQPAMRHTLFECATPLDVARTIAHSEVSLPIHPQLTDDEVAHVIQAVNQWTP